MSTHEGIAHSNSHVVSHVERLIPLGRVERHRFTFY